VTLFLLDECLNEVSLAEECNRTALCEVHRYPRRFRGLKDSEILPCVLTGDKTFLTTDRTIVSENRNIITHPNPGIIVIQQRNPYPPLTTARAKTIIERFKDRVNTWSDIDWSTIYAEIDESGIMISRLTDKDEYTGKFFEFVVADIPNELATYIAELRLTLPS
jgi:hypothetical protein